MLAIDPEKLIETISALSTLVIALFTILLFFSNRKLTRDNSELKSLYTTPNLIAHLEIDQNYYNIIHFRITNTGMGPATNIEFDIKIDEEQINEKKVRLNLLKNDVSINLLKPNDSIKLSLGLGFELLSEPPLKPFDVNIKYKDLRNKSYNDIQTVDVQQFNGFSSLGVEPIKQISEDVKKISDGLQRIFNGSSSLRIDTAASLQSSYFQTLRHDTNLSDEHLEQLKNELGVHE